MHGKDEKPLPDKQDDWLLKPMTLPTDPIVSDWWNVYPGSRTRDKFQKRPKEKGDQIIKGLTKAKLSFEKVLNDSQADDKAKHEAKVKLELYDSKI